MQSQSTDSPAVRPRVVTIAVLLYLINLVASFLYDATDDESLGLSPLFDLLFIGSVYVVTAIDLVVIWLVAKGVNWARFFLTGIVVLVTVGYPAMGDDLLSVHEYNDYTYLSWLSVFLQVACVALLFSKPAAPWFKRAPLIQNDV